jgi:signal transduction histidine kinase
MSSPKHETQDRVGAYSRLTRHERSLWLTTITIVVLAAATIAILTVGAAIYGVFSDPSRGYVLAGGSFLLLGLIIAYLGFQRDALEENRTQILRELDSRSSQLAHANRALQNALKTRDTFLNSVSHELKTPLTCMMAYAEYLVEESLEQEEIRGHARTIVTEGRNLQRLIERLVDVTRMRTGALTLDRKETDVNTVVETVVERLTAEAQDGQVSIHPELAGEPLDAEIDAQRIGEVVETLARGAIQASDPGTRVLVGARSLNREWLEIVVEDQSSRLSEEERKKIFQPFGQLDPEPEGRAGDLGLALPLVKRFVMAHGGLIHIGDGDPRGVVFTILLPRLGPGGEASDPGDEEEDGPLELRRAG